MLKNYTKIEIDELGTKRYLNDEGQHHRLDGPAVEYLDGSKYWYINRISHRNIDPSDKWSDREKYWWFKGERHRVGGSYGSVYKPWCIHNKEYTKKEYFNKVWDI